MVSAILTQNGLKYRGQLKICHL